MKYKKCPRCDVNYILEEEDYCEICKQEMKGLVKYVEEDEEDEDYIEELCPKCRVNYVAEGEKYCEACLQELAHAQKLDSSEWDDDITDEETELVEDLGIEEPVLDDEEELSLDELAEQEGWDDSDEEEEEEEEEEVRSVDDDFEEIDLDDPSLDDDGDEENDEEEDLF